MVFGDKIRIKEIVNVLKSNPLEVYEARLPTITRWEIGKSILTLFPIHTRIAQIHNQRDVLHWLRLNSSVNSLRRSIRRTNPDVVLAETSTTGWIAAHVCKELSIPCIVDCHGLAFAEAKGTSDDDWLQVKHREKDTFTECDYILAVSRRMKDYIAQEFGIPARKIIVIPNGSQPQLSSAQYEFPLKAIYAGTFAYWENVDDFINIAKQANPKTKFYMAGAGPLKNQLLERIEKEKIPVTYLGYIPRQKIFSTLSKMQIGIAPSTKDLARLVASPIKVFDYLASGLPVLTPKIGDWGDLIYEEDCGIALEDDITEKYLEALHTLTDKNIWCRKSLNAVRVIEEKYSWNKTLMPLVDLLTNT